MNWRRTVAAGASALAFGQAAFAEGMQAQCGAERGYGYMAGEGWYDDTSSKAQTVIRIDTETGNVDLRFFDALETWQSATDGGGDVELFEVKGDEPAAFMITVRWPTSTVETYTLTELAPNQATLVHTVTRALGPVVNSRVMTASCKLSRY